MKEYEEFRTGRLSPKRVKNETESDQPPDDSKGMKRSDQPVPTPSSASPLKKRRRSKNCEINGEMKKSSQISNSGWSDDDDGPLLHPGKEFFQSKSGTPYNPDTESGDSVYSDSTEYFRYVFFGDI